MSAGRSFCVDFIFIKGRVAGGAVPARVEAMLDTGVSPFPLFPLSIYFVPVKQFLVNKCLFGLQYL